MTYRMVGGSRRRSGAPPTTRGARRRHHRVRRLVLRRHRPVRPPRHPVGRADSAAKADDPPRVPWPIVACPEAGDRRGGRARRRDGRGVRHDERRPHRDGPGQVRLGVRPTRPRARHGCGRVPPPSHRRPHRSAAPAAVRRDDRRRRGRRHRLRVGRRAARRPRRRRAGRGRALPRLVTVRRRAAPSASCTRRSATWARTSTATRPRCRSASSPRTTPKGWRPSSSVARHGSPVGDRAREPERARCVLARRPHRARHGWVPWHRRDDRHRAPRRRGRGRDHRPFGRRPRRRGRAALGPRSLPGRSSPTSPRPRGAAASRPTSPSRSTDSTSWSTTLVRPTSGSFEHLPEERWDEVMAVNVRSVHYLTTALLPAPPTPGDAGPARPCPDRRLDVRPRPVGAARRRVRGIEGRGPPPRPAPRRRAGVRAHPRERDRARPVRHPPVGLPRRAGAARPGAGHHPDGTGRPARGDRRRRGVPRLPAGGYVTGQVLVVDGGRTGIGRADPVTGLE